MKILRYMTIFPMLLIITSVIVGWRHYDKAKADMVRDLNQALEHVLASSATVDGVLGTLPTSNGGLMLTFDKDNNDFVSQLKIPALRDTACISYRMGNLQKNETSASPVARIYSDTIMLARRTDEGMDIAVTVKAYANPTVANILSHSNSIWPFASFITGIFMLCLMYMAQRMTIKTQSDTLSLTPMQEQLMQLFYASPSRTLTKEEICKILWPKKDNPEDGLYTFISRMKSSLASQSSLRIVNRRGREYVLVDETGKNAS